MRYVNYMYNLIIIEDKKLIRNQLNELVEWSDYGFCVTGLFDNGKIALDFIETNPVDAIITDIEMPVMDGITLAEICNRKHPNIKIMFISAYSEFRYAQSAIKHGVVSYVTKPITMDDLRENIILLKDAVEKSNTRSHITDDDISLEKQYLFTRILQSPDDEVDEIITNLGFIGVDIDSRHTPCAIVQISINEFKEFIMNTWTHGKDRLYNAVSFLTETARDDFFVSLVNTSYSKLDFLVFYCGNDDFESTLNDFRQSVQANINSALGLDTLVTAKQLCENIEKMRSIFAVNNEENAPEEYSVSVKNQLIENAIAYMNEHYSEDISLSEIASHVGFTPNYFSAYFKNVTGEKVVDYLTKIKLEKAKEFLLNPTMSMATICEKVGYKSITHFYKLFKKYMNMTPAEYRNKQIRNDKSNETKV